MPRCHVDMCHCFPCAFEGLFKGVMASKTKCAMLYPNEVNDESGKKIQGLPFVEEGNLTIF
jgi:hypothetical protein